MSATSVGLQTTQVCTSLPSFPLSDDGEVGAMAVAIFDYCSTITQEVQLIWGRKWDVTRVTFTLARYVTLISAAMTTFAAVADRSKYTSCATFNNVIYGVIAAEGLLIIRTFAFWHQNKKVLVWLLVLAVICIAGAVGVTKAVNILHPAPSIGFNATGCAFASRKSTATQYGFLILYELVLMILTVYKRLHFYKDPRSRLVTTLYRDGMIYMACIIMASITNILVILAAHGTYSDIMDVSVNPLISRVLPLTSLRPQLMIHGVLASRILFNLRQSRQSDSVIIDGMFPLADILCTPDAGETIAGGSTIV
ncbi:hypothetical protein EDB19DRAFT_1909732 [Suillus lakei]|nr:hypothetical protein EDB19DRAFT_1909732 [Suillus lakei]